MEYIQEKTADPAIKYFLPKAADQEVSLMWDRYEGQLPECGFCEAGLSCRDCLQGPCISHPFWDENKMGVCGKDKDILAVQSLLRLVVKGTTAYLDQLTDFTGGVERQDVEPKDRGRTELIIRDAQALLANGDGECIRSFPKAVVDRWESLGIRPEGVARDLFKATQKLEGGVSTPEDHLLWAFKTALLGCMARVLNERLMGAVFGEMPPTSLEVNLGLLETGKANILLYGPLSPIIKHKVAAAAEGKNVAVMGVSTDPLLSPFRFPPVTSHGSQEVPIMTGAVDVIVAGDQSVNPSLSHLAREWQVKVIPTTLCNDRRDPESLAQEIIAQAERAFEIRRDIPRDIPEIKEAAVMGFSPEAPLDVGKVVAALNQGKIRGIAILAGSNNVKYTQDLESVNIARALLQNDILCVAEGDASVSLAKYGLLDPRRNGENCGAGVKDLLASLSGDMPAIIDCNTMDFLLALADAGDGELKNLPLAVYFAEANRSMEVAQALWTVAMGVSTYFWPSLPVTGSPRATKALSEFCQEAFGARLHVITDKMTSRAKAELYLKSLTEPVSMSGKSW